MKTYLNNEKTEISYTLQGDYYLPDLAFPDEEENMVGIWGQRHLRYLKKHRKVLYYNLLISGRLNSYLADIDKQAENLFSQIVKQMAEREDINEQLKVDDVIEWVKSMNSIRYRAIEIIHNNFDLF